MKANELSRENNITAKKNNVITNMWSNFCNGARRFWEALGPDCEETENIMDNPEYRELQESIKRANEMYSDLTSSSGNSTKAGKGNSNRNPVVDKVNVKPIKRASGKGKSTSRTVNEEIGER